MSLQSVPENPDAYTDPDADTDTNTTDDADHSDHADNDNNQAQHVGEEHVKRSPETFFDHPVPESFWIPKDSEQDWYDQNATIQRKTSMKLGFSSKNNNKFSEHNSKSFCHRSLVPFNRKPKSTSLLNLPNSQKTSSAAENNLRQSKAAAKVRLFRSRSEPGGKRVLKVGEPGSPKVSCIGRVRSKKDRGVVRTGFWRKLRNILKIRPGSVRTVEQAGSAGPKRLESSGRSES